ncbi:unnamed protein product [Rotaria socialis]|uniref:Uncharacterized protein n=1 Tax=Rotaria socialis TaxID=392032 RepID=A0A820Z3Z5_9BILA|nr:unnamed protein product [Rotaria socialis]
MRILETFKSHFGGCYVPILNDTHRIWTICSNMASTNIPIIFVHGSDGGVGIWSLDIDQLYSDRSVYAIDLPGGARSTRPIFSLDSKEAEKQMFGMIEEWITTYTRMVKNIFTSYDETSPLTGLRAVAPLEPIIERIHLLDEQIPICFLHGEHNNRVIFDYAISA